MLHSENEEQVVGKEKRKKNHLTDSYMWHGPSTQHILEMILVHNFALLNIFKVFLKTSAATKGHW